MYKQEDFHHRKSSCFYSKTIEKYMSERKMHKKAHNDTHSTKKVFHKYTDICACCAYTEKRQLKRQSHGNWQMLHA